MIHRLSVFRGARDNVAKRVEYTWPELCEALLPHEFKPPSDKLKCDAFSPAIYAPNDTRNNDHVEAFSVYAADIDHKSDQDVAYFVECAQIRGWAFLTYSTWRHDTDPNRLRAVFPLSREVTPDEWPELWQAMADALGNIVDPKCGDLSRLYFGAFAPDTPSARAAAFSHVFEGVPVDVDELLGSTTPPSAPPTPSSGNEQVSHGQLERFAKMMKRKRDDHSQHLGDLLLKITQGVPFAEPGNIDNTIFALSHPLAERWPTAAPESLAAHFAMSLDVMATQNPTYAMTPEQVAYKIRRAQDALAAERAKRDAEASKAQRQAIRDAFGNGREEPYTPEEIESVVPHRWIIQRGRAYYTLVKGTYRGPYSADDALSATVRDLSPAHTGGVECYTVSPQGVRAPKSLGQLVRSYGFVADDIAVDLSATRSYFDEDARTLVEAPCPLRPIKPVYHAEIDAWFEALAGSRAHLFKAWVSAVTLLNKPCTGLLLTGHKHTGKSLAPEGLSRLWTLLGFPTPLEDVLGTSFNDAQLRCPLVFGDERLPTDHRGRVLHAELRHYIQSRRRPLRRKFLPNSDMIGAVRVIVSANNENILATTEDLSNFDIGAIVDRWLHIPCNIDAYYYLRDHDTTGWVSDDKIAEHALWLRDNYEWKSNGRFLVHGGDEALHSRLISGTGVRSAVLQFCVGYVLDPHRLDNDPRGKHWIRIHDGQLYVNVQGMLECWTHYVNNEQCPATGRLSRAIAALATEDRPRLSVPGKGRPNYRIIETEHLITWAVDKDFATPEEITAALAKPTEERSKHLAPN